MGNREGYQYKLLIYITRFISRVGLQRVGGIQFTTPAAVAATCRAAVLARAVACGHVGPANPSTLIVTTVSKIILLILVFVILWAYLIVTYIFIIFFLFCGTSLMS